MAKKLFVGNISWNVSDDQLRELFAEHGEILDAIVLKDKFSGRSKGFGFVEYANEEDADAAIKALDGHELDGRPIAVSEARPPKQRF